MKTNYVPTTVKLDCERNGATIARPFHWRIAAAIAAAAVCLGGCQTIGSWFPQRDKVAEARQSATMHDTTLNADVTPEQKINVQLAVAQSFEDEKQPDQAAKIYLNVIKKDSRCVVAYHRLALLYSKKGEWESAQKYFELAIKKAPKDAELQCDQGYSYYLQRRDNEAEACLLKAIAIDEDYACAHNDLGLLWAHRGREDEALKEFAKAGCNEAQTHANLAMAYSVENRLDDARVQYRLALTTDPNLAIAKNGLAALDSVDRSLSPPDPVQSLAPMSP